jgi:predicted metal-binding protein
VVRKISEHIPETQLQEDLERYRRRAIELGATDAKIIGMDGVVIDERVVAKCVYPKCPGYGTNVNCPPYAMTTDETRKLVNNFHYAIFVKIEVPPEHTAGKQAIEKQLVNPYRRKLAEIVARLEAEAFHDGYHLAVGFGSGSCKTFFCPNKECEVLVPGHGCPHRLKARSPMEAVGMDVYTMAARAGWDIYPIGDATEPSEVPHGLRLGLVLIY